jgi:hypothetical protein
VRPRVGLGVLGVMACAFASTIGCASRAAPIAVRAAANAEADDEAALLDVVHVSVAEPADAIVRVVGPKMTCTGTLIADDRVLTAHHCVVERGDHGEFLPKLVDASVTQVELGGDYLPWGTVGVRAIVAPPCGEAGGRGDVAVLVLERKLVGMTPFAVRIEQPPVRGERLDPMGFGRCAASSGGIRRRTRDSGVIDTLHSGTFDMAASICPGDSGGPVLARTSGAVIGVVSLSAMDADESTAAPSVMARIDAFRSMFVYARAISDGADPADLPPLSCDP